MIDPVDINLKTSKHRLPNRKQCSAINCHNYPTTCPELAFHRFPKDPDRCARWVLNLGNDSLTNICSDKLHEIYRVCSAHFHPSQFRRPVDVHSGLNWDAVPTIVDTPNPPPSLDLKRKPPKKRQELTPKKISSMAGCSAWGCSSRSEKGVRMYDFPTDTERRKKWLAQVSRSNFTITKDYKNKKLCEAHFEADQFVKTRKGNTRLIADAIPTIFVHRPAVKRRKAPRPQVTPGPVDVNIEHIAACHSYSAKVPGVEERGGEETGGRERESEGGEDPGHETPAQPGPSTAAEPNGPELNRTTNDHARSTDERGTWVIVVDKSIQRVESLPGFFHGDYCLPRSIRWTGEDYSRVEPENLQLKDQNDLPLKRIIEVNGAWEWLGVDIRGPMPTTLNGSKYILTVTDYYSKWVEAFPLRVNTPLEVANYICDIISHFGFPLKILSRLPRPFIEKVNAVLTNRLADLSVPLCIFHRQTGTLDLHTQSSIDRMLTGLLKDHAPDWEVYLPAKIFSLCFQEHSTTKERPFSVLHCKGLQPIAAPRPVPFSVEEIQESTFVIQLKQKDTQDTDVNSLADDESENQLSGGNALMQVSFVVQQ